MPPNSPPFGMENKVSSVSFVSSIICWLIEQKPAPKVSQPASFHTLPREIRQKILLESFTYVIAEDSKFNKNITILYFLYFKWMKQPYSAPHILAWAASLLSTDAVVASDISYVVDKALAVLEQDLLTIKEINYGDLKLTRWNNLLFEGFWADEALCQKCNAIVRRNSRQDLADKMRAGRRVIDAAIGIPNATGYWAVEGLEKENEGRRVIVVFI